ncbi:unnamed protein product [Gulo gulo]|uniref:Uncharacterized protein n=1 Tax=Gulo gulo TaxID=48420 RepID=A0A9X9QAU0_GULGU|nr:unnamed protein product [Gulo gulo]
MSAVDFQGMEQHEHMEPAKQYSTYSAVLSIRLTHWKKLPPHLLSPASPSKCWPANPSPSPTYSRSTGELLMPQYTFSDRRGCKRGAGCTVWDPVKRGILRQHFFFSLHPSSTLPPWAPSFTMAHTVP